MKNIKNVVIMGVIIVNFSHKLYARFLLFGALFFFAVTSCVQAAAVPSEKRVEKNVMPVALALLIDHNDEKPTSTDKLVGTETLELKKHFESNGNAAILASSSLLYNLVYRAKHWNDRKHRENKELRRFSLATVKRRFFHFHGTQCILSLSEKNYDQLKSFFNTNA